MRTWIGLLLTLLISATGECKSLLSEKPLAHYKVDTWTEDTGFPGSEITAIQQSSDGYLWIGTGSGLFRFDGVRFVVYDKSSTPRLPLSRISAVYQNRTGDVLIGTFGRGLSKLANGAITTMVWQDGLPSNYVSAICEDSEGALWVGTDGKGMCRIERDTIIQYKDTSGLLSNHITAFAPDRDAIWVGTTLGLQRYHAGTLRPFNNGRLPSLHILSLLMDGADLWIGTTGGLSRLRNDSVTTYTRSNGLPSNSIKAIQRERAGVLWLATLGGGLVRFSDGIFEAYVPEALPDGADVEAVYVDFEGSIWAGLGGGGLFRLRDETFSWFSTSQGLADNEANTVMVDRAGTLWVGTGKGLSAIRNDGKTKSYMPPGDDMSAHILALNEDKQGVIWVGTRAGGLFVVRGGSLSPAPFRLPEKTDVWQIFTDHENTTWLGTRTGLWRIQGSRHDRFTKATGLSHDDIRALCEDQSGHLWIGTSYGLNRFKDGRFTQYKFKQGISNDIIVALHPDSNGDLWIGTFDGLNRLRDGVFTHFKVKDGLPDDNILSITEDNLGYFWIASAKGLYRVRKNDLNAFADGRLPVIPTETFDKSDGLRSQSFSGAVQPPAWKDFTGRLWFATAKGVAMIDPRNIRTNRTPPLVTIEGISIDRTPIPLAGKLKIGPGQSQLEITYTAPSFVNSSNIFFRYLLEGFDKEWINAGTRRVAYFTNIPPGDYRFRVLARNEDGVWSKKEASLAIVVQPPFWLTWWFQSIVIALFLSIGPAIYFRRVTQLKRRHAQQQEFSIRLIASQEAERKRIAAELHDSLGQNIIIIKNRALLGKQAGDDKDTISEQLDEITKTATSTLDEMRKIAHNLRPLNLERFGLTDTIAQVTKDVGSASEISLQSMLDNIDGLMSPEMEMHLFRIIQEALNNIVKHSHATSGSVSVTKEGSVIHAVIRDNGTGFEIGSSRGGHRSSGFGLEDIAHRASLIGARFEMSSSPEGTTLDLIISYQEPSA
jgi:ligand-binding sensor domain-containing protein/signal transduction histidine kinase